MPWRILIVRPYQLAVVPESALRIALSGMRGESSQVTYSGLIGSALSFARASIVFPPIANIGLNLLAPRTIFLSLEQRDQCSQGLHTIANQVEFHRVTNTKHTRINIDLDAACLSFFWQELRIGEAGTNHQQAYHSSSSCSNSVSFLADPGRL